MSKKCNNCNEKLTLEKQNVGSQISSDSEKPNGAIYTVKCRNCGFKNPDKVSKMIKKE